MYEFLKGCHPAAIATVDANGIPYVATIYFIVEQETGDLPLLHSGEGTLMLGRVTPKKIRWADFRNAARGVDPFEEV